MSSPTIVQTSVNFDFLQEYWPDLASLASLAETYMYDDPPSSLVKLRMFAEKMVEILYYELGLQKPYDAYSFKDLLTTTSFKQAIPAQIINFLHLIRKEGNKGAHEGQISLKSEDVVNLVRKVHQLSLWFYGTITKEVPLKAAYVIPGKALSHHELIAEKEALEAKLNALEALQNKKRAEEPHIPATEALIEETLERATMQAETLGLTENQTRELLIDSMLRDAEWVICQKITDYNPSSDKAQVIQEYPVGHQPNLSGQGYVDYVLMGKNGHPIAVLEVKKTSVNAEVGKNQAELYAEGIERTTGIRPFVFYSNGYDTFFWDDRRYPPRRIWGIYDSEKLEYLLIQRKEQKPLSEIEINTETTGRSYQLECIRRVYEHFEQQRRKALIVMATGTGKTRVAVSLVDGLMRARWVKRVLFLVDRNELRKQAVDAFKTYLPNSTPVIMSRDTRNERNARVYVSTYPAMMQAFTEFNVGFFDLIIADESHRSIYKSYRELFQYFDSLQIGLTATPVDYVARNTYRFFELEDKNPTFNYSLDEAINNKPPYLVAPKVNNETTEFLTRGIRYNELTDEQRAELEDQDDDPESVQYERDEVDKKVMNKETNRKIIRNLMEKGIKNANGTRPGKSIIFARSREHAYALQEILDEEYPQYTGKMSAVIECKNPRSEELIEGFKGHKKEYAELDIAVSVDMLDTGVDVPEVVNLVFAKPLYSKVKFWQMIGRGTRLCPNLFGTGHDKSEFLIFDPWRNFEFFKIKPEGIEPRHQISVPERLFKARLDLLLTLDMTPEAIELKNSIIASLRKGIQSLPSKTPSVKEKWQELERVGKDSFWEKLTDDSLTLLSQHIQPLMCWSDITGDDDALRFDIKVARLDLAWVQDDDETFMDLQEQVIEDVERLRTNLSQVKPQLDLIEAVKKAAWWNDISLAKLEDMRLRLRDLMKYRVQSFRERTRQIDITDYTVEATVRDFDFKDDLQAYRERLVFVLTELASNNITLQKIRRGKPITESDIVSLQSLILERDPSLKLEDLQKLFPDKAKPIDLLIRSLIGLDLLTVQEEFDKFRHTHTTLKANQIQFLNLLEQEIAKGGGLEEAQLYEQPFTSIHVMGIEGVFGEDETKEIIAHIKNLAG